MHSSTPSRAAIPCASRSASGTLRAPNVWTNSPGARSQDLRDHQRQQRVRGDIERHAEEDVGAALVELARQPAVGHVELEQRVAGRSAIFEVGHVPRARRSGGANPDCGASRRAAA
jgi:hypothetical protein